MKLKKMHWFGIIFGIMILAASIFLYGEKIFYFVLGIGFIVLAAPFVLSTIIESAKTKEKEEMFLNLARDLVESVNSGTPISKGIINLQGRDYGSLTINVNKLINQISMGISVKDALKNFSRDVNISTVSRAITMIGQAEEAGGEIGKILESVAESVGSIDKLKKERRAAVYDLVIQGYIIVLIFIVIILVMQFKIVPMISEIGNMGAGSSENFGGISLGSSNISPQVINNAFLGLLIVQGFFSGIVIGKMSEGTISAGIKHSFFLVVISVLISTGASAFF